MSLAASMEANALGRPPAVDPAVAAQRDDLAQRVCALLENNRVLEPHDLAQMLGTSTALVMFAVRELERAGMLRVEDVLT